MNVEQIKTLVNEVAEEILGEEAVQTLDLSDAVQIGNAILDATSYDNYVRTLVNHIGKVEYSSRVYSGGAPNIYMDSWEFGSIRERISFNMPDAEDNPSWALTDGTTYNQDKFTAPSINVKFFNGRDTYQIPLSITERQVKESFSNWNQLNGFISGLQIAVENAIVIRNDAMIMNTINSLIAYTINDDNGANVKAIDVLSLYNTQFKKSLTKADALTDEDFNKFLALKMGVMASRLSRPSKLFNASGEEKFTPKDQLHVVMLTDVAKSTDVYLQSGVFHNELTALPEAEEVPYWQGTGTDYAFDSISKIDVTVKDPSDATKTIKVTQDGILAVMFDKYACGVTNYDRRTTAHQNNVAEFTNYWYKVDAEYFNDLGENAVVFYLGGSEGA